MKWVKRILAAVGILVLLFVIAAVILVATFDPNDYKQRIEAAVEQTTGRELALQGDIDLSLFPWLGMKLGPAVLGNAKGFGDEPFARVKNVDVRVALLPLFRGEVRADTVHLKGLEANLTRNAQGVGNWEDLMQDTKPQAPEQPQQPGRKLVLAVGGIEIEDAAVHWRDAQAGTDLRVAPVDLSTGELAFGEPFDIDLALRAQNAKPAIKADVNLTGEATVNPDTQRYALADARLTVDAAGEGLPKDGVEAALETAIKADLTAGVVAVQPLTLEVADLRLAGQLDARELNATPQITGELNSDAFNPRKLLTALGQSLPPTSDPAVLNTAMLKLGFNATPESATLSKLEMQLDDTHLTGQAAVKSFTDPAINFDLAVDAIDLDRYMPPEAKAKPNGKPKPAPPADDDLGLPIDMLRDLHLDGRLTVGKLKASGLNMNDVKATITARDGLIRVEPLGMALYQGSMKGNASLDVRGNTPKFTMYGLLDAVQAGALLTELAGDDYLTGTTRLAINVNTQGQKLSALQQQLNGSMNASFKEGSISGSELAGRIARVVAFFRGQPAAAASDSSETRFTSLTGTASITNGILSNNNLALVAPLILAKGQGKVNIPQSVVDYTLNIALNDAGKPKNNRFVPLEIGGTLSDLDYRLALTDVVKEQAKQAIQQELQEKKQNLEGELQDKLKDKLKDRFGF